MPRLTGSHPERLANYFVRYLVARKSEMPHVYRIASWIGLLVLGIAKIVHESEWAVPRTDGRQLRFTIGSQWPGAGRVVKVRFNHKLGTHGGIEFVEIRPGRGQPEGNTLLQIQTLEEAESFYRSPARRLMARGREL
jgi:hypothetical protein